jgi:hypothetical protein
MRLILLNVEILFFTLCPAYIAIVFMVKSYLYLSVWLIPTEDAIKIYHFLLFVVAVISFLWFINKYYSRINRRVGSRLDTSLIFLMLSNFILFSEIYMLEADMFSVLSFFILWLPNILIAHMIILSSKYYYK